MSEAAMVKVSACAFGVLGLVLSLVLRLVLGRVLSLVLGRVLSQVVRGRERTDPWLVPSCQRGHRWGPPSSVKLGV